MNKIKLIATDMDGTLLNNAKEVPSDFIPWVLSHDEYKTVIASGRQYYTLLRDFDEVKDNLIFIADNGGFAVYKDEVIYDDLMSREDVVASLEAVQKIPGSAVIVCGVESAYMKPSGDEAEEQGHMYYARIKFDEDLLSATSSDKIIKIAVFIPDFRAEEVYRNFPKLPDTLLPVLSGDSWIDIANKTVNKGAALSAIQKKFGIRPDECMAFGDYPNDIELLEVCSESYCMANGHERVKAIAKYSAPSNEEHGVMQILQSRGRFS